MKNNFNNNILKTKVVKKDPTIKSEALVVITPEFSSQCDLLCSNFSDLEWSGVMFYEIEGDITDINSMILTPKEILPLDVGTKSFTSYNIDGRYTEYFMANIERLGDYHIGHIHSHNTMGVFFSGTDDSELMDNTSSHNFYFSLIVNNKKDYCAKISREVKETYNLVKSVYKNKDGVDIEDTTKDVTKVTSKIEMFSCNISHDRDMSWAPEGFVDAIKKLSGNRKPKTPTRKPTKKPKTLKAGLTSFNTITGEVSSEFTELLDFIFDAKVVGNKTLEYFKNLLGELTQFEIVKSWVNSLMFFREGERKILMVNLGELLLEPEIDIEVADLIIRLMDELNKIK